MRFTSLLVVLGLAASLRADDPKPVALKPRWHKKLPPYAHYDDIDAKRYEDGYKWTRDAIESARKELDSAKLPAVAEYAPAVAGNLVIARTPVGPCAYALDADPKQQPPAKAGEIIWASEADRALAVMARDAAGRAVLDRMWGPADGRFKAGQFFSASLAGRSSTSATTLYFVDDFAVLPTTGALKPTAPGPFHGLDSNSLCGVDLESGKLVTSVGSRLSLHNDGKGLTRSIFLGPPLAADDRLYVINEKDKQLRLLALDPKFPFHNQNDAKGEEKGVLVTVPLGTTSESAETEFTRRMHALEIVATDKFLLCPTHLGAIVAVDRKTMKEAWRAEYRKENEKRDASRFTMCKSMPPVVHGEFVVYLPPEFLTIEVCGLADGKRAWRRERDGALYLAGARDGKAIVVENQALRAFHLKDGKEAWKKDLPGMPTGYGVWKDGKYYLPVGTEVRVFDAKDGKLTAALMGKEKESFGNLLIHKGKLISQTLEALAVYDLP